MKPAQPNPEPAPQVVEKTTGKMRLSRSIVGVEEAEAVARVILDDGYLGMGAEVQRFELALAEFLGVPGGQVACCNSGTAALQLAVESVLAPGDEVLVQSLTFVASFQAILAAGMVPVSCEILPDSITIDLKDAATRITNRTKAIMPVHYASNPADLEQVYEFARRHGLRVIEDAAHAFGCTHQGRKIGSFGDIQCFSFDGIKNITCGEGGAVVTGDQAALARIKDARLLGVERDTDQRFSGQRSWDFDVKRRGYRYHMSNLNAAIGLVQLKRFQREFAPKRVNLARRYRERLAGHEGLRLLEADLGAVVPHLQPIRVLDNLRSALRAHLQHHGIETGVHYKPNHQLALFGNGSIALPVTEGVYTELLSLPLHPGLEISDIDRIVDLIVGFYKQR